MAIPQTPRGWQAGSRGSRSSGWPAFLGLLLSLFLCLPVARAADGADAGASGAAASGAVAPGAGPAHPLRVVASFSILGDMVRQIGGADVQVDALVGPDGDAHEYEPTPADARALGAAQVLVVNGLNFETWMNRLVKASNFKGITVVAAEGVQPRDFDEDDIAGHADGDADHAPGGGSAAPGGKSGHGHHDPHVDPHAWQDLSNGVVYARNIGAALAKADPSHADAYRQRTEAYVARMQALDQRVRQSFAALPPERRRVVTSHDAFGYFGRAYGVTFISTMGISTDAEPSAGDVARIIDQVKQEKVPAVFLENVSNPRLGQRIAHETGAKLGGTLYSDALAKPGLPASTYLGMFEWNLAAFMAALKP
ncbi:metal ABC transporter substrate-binding protein [Bordetella bronchialis]|uniref:metal ABC transporter substrate-binding protein n=1 Tax=Bordetella bronchialis TaxID=463025 RepID=UPI0009F594B4|nr:metal ABC transporter substrate-binding protein [Bordetella bronchialis]